MSILKINKYNTGKRCADCKHFHMAQNISESVCDLRSMTGTFRKYPFHPCPSHVNCHDYEQDTGRNHCKCGCFMYPAFNFCPICGKPNKWKPGKDHAGD